MWRVANVVVLAAALMLAQGTSHDDTHVEISVYDLERAAIALEEEISYQGLVAASGSPNTQTRVSFPAQWFDSLSLNSRSRESKGSRVEVLVDSALAPRAPTTLTRPQHARVAPRVAPRGHRTRAAEGGTYDVFRRYIPPRPVALESARRTEEATVTAAAAVVSAHTSPRTLGDILAQLQGMDTRLPGVSLVPLAEESNRARIARTVFYYVNRCLDVVERARSQIGFGADTSVHFLAVAVYPSIAEPSAVVTVEHNNGQSVPTLVLTKGAASDFASYWDAASIYHGTSNLIFSSLVASTTHLLPRMQILNEAVADFLACSIVNEGNAQTNCLVGAHASRRRVETDGLHTVALKYSAVTRSFQHVIDNACYETKDDASSDTDSCGKYQLAPILSGILWRIRSKLMTGNRASVSSAQQQSKLIGLTLEAMASSLQPYESFTSISIIVFRDCLLTSPHVTEAVYQIAQSSFVEAGLGVGATWNPVERKSTIGSGSVPFHARANTFISCPARPPTGEVAAKLAQAAHADPYTGGYAVDPFTAMAVVQLAVAAPYIAVTGMMAASAFAYGAASQMMYADQQGHNSYSDQSGSQYAAPANDAYGYDNGGNFDASGDE